MTLFLGIGVSFVTYINKQMELQSIRDIYGLKWDLISVSHAVLMVLSFSVALYFLIQADSVNDELFEVEENLNA